MSIWVYGRRFLINTNNIMEHKSNKNFAKIDIVLSRHVWRCLLCLVRTRLLAVLYLPSVLYSFLVVIKKFESSLIECRPSSR